MDLGEGDNEGSEETDEFLAGGEFFLAGCCCWSSVNNIFLLAGGDIEGDIKGIDDEECPYKKGLSLLSFDGDFFGVFLDGDFVGSFVGVVFLVVFFVLLGIGGLYAVCLSFFEYPISFISCFLVSSW